MGNVSHFSWWNCDQFTDAAFLNLTIKDDNDNPLSYSYVGIQRVNDSLSSYQLTDVYGRVYGFVPANEALNAFIMDECNNYIFLPMGSFSTGSVNNVVLTYTPNGNANLVIVQGNLSNCSGSPVSNGYVKLSYGNNHTRFVETDSNGDFSINSMYCLPDVNFTLEGFDFDTMQTTSPISYIYSTNSTTVQVGNLQACNSITEFITYQIDNDSSVYILSNIDVNFSSNGLSINYYGTPIQNGIYIWCNSNIVGNQSNFSIEGGGVGLIDQSSSGMTFSLNYFGAVGDYIDISFYGNYIDYNNQNRTITGVAHVIRDN